VQTFDFSTVIENQGDGVALTDKLYRIYLPDGTIKQQGMLNDDGDTIEVRTAEPVKVKCKIGAGDWKICEDSYDFDDLEEDDEDEDAKDDSGQA
jgi:type VI secretion system secreted protein VgrG